ncbi:hypothetical protein Entas_4604 (plasmid) [Enterobacter soli]|nr:hypothetical protein Entas_4588 [Enterobacter soli]AEN67283.1 hypothetical protein Entas_4604 [Enterobacter soli]
MKDSRMRRAGWPVCLLVTAGLCVLPGQERGRVAPGCQPVLPRGAVMVIAPAIQISLRGSAGDEVYSLYPERDGEGALTMERLQGERRGGVHART